MVYFSFLAKRSPTSSPAGNLGRCDDLLSDAVHTFQATACFFSGKKTCQMRGNSLYRGFIFFFRQDFFFRELNLLPGKLGCFLNIDAGFTMKFPFGKANLQELF